MAKEATQEPETEKHAQVAEYVEIAPDQEISPDFLCRQATYLINRLVNATIAMSPTTKVVGYRLWMEGRELHSKLDIKFE